LSERKINIYNNSKQIREENKEFYDATELNTAQNCMLAEIKGRH
jgi:hypothetical protein